MKTNINHTKGPWKIEINDGELEIWSQNTFIAGVTHDLYFTTEKSGQHAANAALIAAAPEMLEALESIYKKLCSEKFQYLQDDFENELLSIEKCFEKARGK